MVASGQFRDADGRRVLRWDPESGEEGIQGEMTSEILEELEALRREVAELSERVDFAERLLQRPPEERTATQRAEAS
jgi:hypothetical protein